MTLDEFMEKAPAQLEAFKYATLAQHAKDPAGFPLDLEEWDWWNDVKAYVIYVEHYGDMDQNQIDELMGDSDGPDGA